MPPMSLQITGRPCWNASCTTSGPVSHQIDGTTTQSICAISLASSARLVGAAEGDVVAVVSRAGRSNCVLKLGRLELEIRAVDPEMAVEVVAEDVIASQQDVGALERSELAEEREAVARPVLLGRRRSASLDRAAP